ncbi:MAG TPA: hypothetical protein VKU01_04715 [Bryobacteraceae bacterium]|nr:hypothetical protein [Bryobacteraceae bacterium]
MRFRTFRLAPRTLTCLIAVLLVVVAAATAFAQTTLQAQLSLRAMTRDDLAAYGLPSTTELTAGLTTVGVGQPAHIEAMVAKAVPASDITGVTWSITKQPAGSSAQLGDSPLPAAALTYEPSDNVAWQVADRKLLRPDVAGQYTVSATITTGSNGTTTVTVNITAANYVGISACKACHSGAVGPDMATSWAKTLHAEIFKDNINGADGTTYASSCWGCHTVGYDTATTAANGGFDKIMTQLNWTPPAVMQPGNWDAMPDALKNVANIQCENCHGPGSQHVSGGGNTSMISVSLTSGACAQCHAAATHHVKSGEWVNSLHAVTTTDPTGAGREGCVGCHTGGGFITRIKGGTITDTSYSTISCQACHEPHGQTVPDGAAHQIRTLANVTLADGTVVSNGGEGTLCMNCHQSRQNASVYAATAAASAHFGPHDGPQGDMIAGANGFTYGKFIPSSAHGDMVKDSCVNCHMQTVAATDPALTHVGGHTFKPSWVDANGNKQDLVAACQTCHGPDITSFDFQLMDYNDDGVIEGVQTEVQHLLDQLSAMLPPVGDPKTSLTIDSTWTRPQLEAAYNWQFVNNDGSKGIHNTAYAVGLLKASIADLSKQQ